SRHASGLASMRPYHVARAWTLAPATSKDLAEVVRLSATELRENAAAFWSLTQQAAVLHRAGRSQQAIALLHRSLSADDRPGAQVLNWLWLALAYQRLGKPDEAQRWLDRANRWLDQLGDEMPINADRLGLHLHNWLEAHLLRKEAAALLP